MLKVIHGFSSVPAEARGAVLAIGNFDGVHRGHQALIREAKRIAAATPAPGAPSGVIIFDPHPREHFHPDRPHFRLTALDRKLELFDAYGARIAVVLTFDASLAGMTAEAFVSRVLVEGLAVRHVIVGYDFHFGRNRGGDVRFLESAGLRNGFGVTVVPPVAEGGEVFSSSAIRAELAQGDVESAAEALGHWWRVSGIVIGGAHLGTGFGFPTANIDLPKCAGLAHGIYAVRVILADGRRFSGAAYLGTRPTVDDGPPKLETFLLDFSGNLYGQVITLEFVARIRGDKRFADFEELKAQMARDCEEARRRLAAAPETPV
ncbi:MAG TPA: bifunctional riboflavin kinase/FAD synthetase [Hyphomicrobiaceae bacterium]|nr:bifunctional riboflavin kinase/FAD synthetase [Hyphomicrobiaceae bacterium]